MPDVEASNIMSQIRSITIPNKPLTTTIALSTQKSTFVQTLETCNGMANAYLTDVRNLVFFFFKRRDGCEIA